MEHLAVINLDSSTVKSIARLLKIWKERHIFDTKIQVDLDRIWATKSLEMTATSDASGDGGPPAKKQKKGKCSKN